MDDTGSRRAQLARYDAQIQHMKMIRNTQVPISLLPPDILASIFIIYRDACVANKMQKSPFMSTTFWWTVSQPKTIWLAVSQVCSHWRAVALNYPLLWSCLAFGSYQSPKLVSMMTERSKKAPLRLDVWLDFSPKSPHWQALFELLGQGERLQHLDLMFDPEHKRWGLFVDKIANVSVPLLQTLVLRNPSWDVTLFAHVFTHLFSGGIPSLRRLELAGFSIRPIPSLMAGLTYLHLAARNLASNPAGGDFYLFEALEETKNLREFVLVTLNVTEKPKPGRVVNLPYLESFTFDGSLEFLPKFLRRIAVPVSASLKFRCRSFHNGVNVQKTFQKLAYSLSSAWLRSSVSHPHVTEENSGEASSVSIRSVQATNVTTQDGCEILNLFAWFEPKDFVHDPRNGTTSSPESIPAKCPDRKNSEPNLTFSITWHPAWASLHYFLATFPLNDVLSIFLDVQFREKSLVILRRLPSLASIMVTEQCAADFLNCVINDPVILRYQSRMRKKKTAENALEPIHPPPRYFSKLVCLGFRDVDFGLFDYVLDGVEEQVIDMDVFLEFLEFRKHSAPIRILRLKNCVNVIADEIMLMEEKVQKVIWDERVCIKDDFDWKQERGLNSYASNSEDTAPEDVDDEESLSTDDDGEKYPELKWCYWDSDEYY